MFSSPFGPSFLPTRSPSAHGRRGSSSRMAALRRPASSFRSPTPPPPTADPASPLPPQAKAVVIISANYMLTAAFYNDTEIRESARADHFLDFDGSKVPADIFLSILTKNATLLNLVESTITDALMQKNDEIAGLLLEMQQMQEILSTTEHQREAWKQLALEAYEMNQSFVLQSGMQGTNSHASSNELDSTCSGNQALNMDRSAVETTEPNLKCKLCNADVASMLILPCQHLCACKSCGVQLLTCPVCNMPKVDAIEVRFG
ncbi:hypothetical protein EJB05_13105 [Eragrostis curvula]|uniref:RING-type domain-containing protein n=1 Tax=Eragrostis curvula TaxID=38414 RepID=A0A5J9VVD3_9POAL|nr:hypothetical protein EJB05_13105 [Eragrostis curvula]